jgi:anhydro-N-acetylmuramic acid kinase
MATTRHIIGCMTGTSLDGLDAALVRVVGSGLDMSVRLVAAVSLPLGDLAGVLGAMAAGRPHPPIDYLRAARRLGALHADACVQLQQRRDGVAIDFVVAHGQTIWHAPADPAGPMSWQLFDPWPIVRRLGVPVCWDLRQVDLIAGGQGAPITPIADPILYAGGDADMVVNLGGIMNVTLWTNASNAPGSPGLRGNPDSIRGHDVCPCNILLDGLVRRLYPGRQYDDGGATAAAGQPDDTVRRTIERHAPPRNAGGGSLGREQFNDTWLDDLVRQLQHTPPATVLRSAVDYVAARVGEVARASSATAVVLAGGGARNHALVDAIRHAARPHRVTTSDELGIPSDAREAMAFAVLGALSRDGVPVTLPAITGAAAPGSAGAWAYP